MLDLGSNSFRLLVADAEADGNIRPVLREREMLHLGGVIALDPTIPDDMIDRCVGAVKRLHDLAVRTGSSATLAVATSAIRDAANRSDVVAALETAAGSPVRVLSGNEEADLAFLGVAASIATPPGPHMVLDLGGGSLEIAIGEGRTIDWSTSLDVGVSRLHSAHVDTDPMSIDNRRAIETAVRTRLEPAIEAIAGLQPTSTVAVGGSIRSIGQVVAQAAIGWQPPTLNQFTLSRSDVTGLRDQLIGLPVEERRTVPAMKESRAEHLGTAAVIVAEVMRALDIEETFVSFWGLREGVVLEELGRPGIATGHDLRPNAVERMASQFTPDTTHSDHVALLADSIFTQTRRFHELGDEDRELLRYAARLHTIGQSVAFRNYPQHSAYLLEHSELRGFGPTELAILMSVVRSHRRGKAKAGFAPYEGLYRAGRARVDAIVPILHTADNLDRSLDQSIEDVALQITQDRIEIELIGDRAHLRRRWAESAVESMHHGLGVHLHFRDEQLTKDPLRSA